MRLSLNPYGLAYSVGLHGSGTDRANPQPLGLDGFVSLVRQLKLSTIELDWRWTAPMSDADLMRLRETVAGLELVYSHWLLQEAGDSLIDPIRRASTLGASILRLHLTPVLEGARSRWGPRWGEMVAHARRILERDAPNAADAGLVLAIENHQDFGSEELVDIVETLGEHVGIVLDTGNPFAVGEDPVAFARRAAHRIRHVHLKDYVAQFTDEGYRLVRCAIGDGCVPFDEIAAILEPHRGAMAASIEPGALEARHIRLFLPGWWQGYPRRDARELAALLGRLRINHLPDGADWRTPWERQAAPGEIAAYEMAQIHRSVAHLKGKRWMQSSA